MNGWQKKWLPMRTKNKGDLKKMREIRNIPFSPPDITEEEINEVIDTLRSGWITTGPKTKEFEKKIAEFCGTEKAVTMNSATACMEMTLRLLGVGPGDEVITSAYTYSASASVIHHVGAKIVLIDTQVDSVEMDYEQLANAITEKTKVIIPVDIAGIMCDYDKIYEIVESFREKFVPNNEIQEKFGRIIIMADAAHSFGASYKGEMSGSVADFTAFSFHAVKNLTTSEGGAVTWKNQIKINDEEIYKQYMLLILHGQSKDALAKSKLGSWEYDIVAPYYKCNMTDIMASLGLAQLRRYPDMLAHRHNLIKLYDECLKDIGVQCLTHYNAYNKSSGHLYFVRILGENENFRNKFILKMAERGIATNVHYKPLPMHTAYKTLGFDSSNYPKAFSMYENEVTLPLNTKMINEDVRFIVDNFKEILNELRKEK